LVGAFALAVATPVLMAAIAFFRLHRLHRGNSRLNRLHDLGIP